MPELTQQLSQTLMWIIALVLAAPLVAAVADISRRQDSFSVRALSVGYVFYGFRVLFLLCVQFGAIVVVFFVGPVWFFALFLTVMDFIVTRWTPEALSLGVPILCNWFHLEQPNCIYVLVTYHVISAMLAYVVFRYGHRVLDTAKDWYHRASQRLAERLQG